MSNQKTVLKEIVEASGMSQNYLANIPKFLSENEALAAVKENGYALQYVDEEKFNKNEEK